MRALAACFVLCLAFPVQMLAQAPDRYAAPDQAYARKDYGQAHNLWIELATEGNGPAYFNLGRLYLFGEGVRIDPVEAYKWFEMARRAGVTRASAGLARLGPLMTPSDVAEAERRIDRWYTDYPATRR